MTRPEEMTTTRRLAPRAHFVPGRFAGIVIAASLAAVSLVAPSAAHAEGTTEQGLVAWYKLNESAGTTVADSSGNGRTAAVEGAAGWNAGAGFTFSGGNASAGSSIKLPNNIIAGLDSITVSADVLVDTSLTGAVFMYTLGNLTTAATSQSGTGYLFSGAPSYVAKITNTGYGNEKNTAKNAEVTKGVWKHLSYTQTGTTGTLYEDGVQVGQNTAVSYTPAQINNGVTTRNYLGKSSYAADPSFKGKLRDFRIYNRALTAAELGELSTTTAAEDLAAAASAVAFTGSSAVQANITVPTTANGVPITWTSSKPYVLSTTGKVIRPSENVNAQVTLTAKLALRGQSVIKEYPFTVLADPSPLGKAQYDSSTVVLPGAASLTADLALPATGATFGSALGWSSSDDSVITAAGVITRPAYGQPDATAVLTATATNGTKTSSFAYPVVVPAKPRATDAAGVTTSLDLALDSATVGFGAPVTAAATVTASDAGQVAGTVTFVAGSFTATRDLIDGTAAVALPSTLPLGATTVTARYSGYTDLPASTDEVVLTVADIVAPVTRAVVVAKARTVTLAAADELSSIARIEYRIGTSGEWLTYTAPIVVGSAETVVQFRATDAATNVEVTNQVVVPDASESLVSSVATVVTLTPRVTFGTAGSLTVRVGGSLAAPTGTVRVLSGDTLVGSATLVAGRATVALSARSAAAVHTLRVEYSGDADYSASSATAVYTVTKAASRSSLKVTPTALKSSKRGVVTLAVTVPSGLKAAGKVTLTVTRGGSSVVAKTLTLGGTGIAKTTLPKLRKGTYRFTLSYAGSASFTGSSMAKTVSVRK